MLPKKEDINRALKSRKELHKKMVHWKGIIPHPDVLDPHRPDAYFNPYDGSFAESFEANGHGLIKGYFKNRSLERIPIIKHLLKARTPQFIPGGKLVCKECGRMVGKEHLSCDNRVDEQIRATIMGAT
jgi:hypothetical protein